MPIRRTDLRDELTALIAAGRELPPDHDRVLAEVFLDRLASSMAPPSRTRHALAVIGKPRHLLGAVILGLAVVGVASVQPFHQAGSTNIVVQPQPVKAVPAWPFKAIPAFPGKPPVVPLPPKAPPAPQAPAPKAGS
jgi:hypothetical protein